MSGCHQRQPVRTAAPRTRPVEQLRAEAAAVAPLVRSVEVRRFLAATARLPSIAPRGRIYADRARTRVIPEAEWSRLPGAERAGWRRFELDEELYYLEHDLFATFTLVRRPR